MTERHAIAHLLAGRDRVLALGAPAIALIPAIQTVIRWPIAPWPGVPLDGGPYDAAYALSPVSPATLTALLPLLTPDAVALFGTMESALVANYFKAVFAFDDDYEGHWRPMTAGVAPWVLAVGPRPWPRVPHAP